MLASRDEGLSVIAQPWSLGRRFAAASVLVLGIGALVFATAGTSVDGRIGGAGSTLVNPVLQRVSTAYQGYLAADRVDVARQEGSSGDWTGSVTALDYDPVGSVGGLVRLADPALTFAATEVPVAADQLQAQGLAQFPLINAAVAPVVNLDLGGAALTLDADTLAGLFGGTITTWNDPAIAALNPGVALPDLPVAVRHRADGSGTSWTFTGYLARSAAWTAGQAAQLDWPAGDGAEGNRGVIAAVQATPGAIGYAEVGQARRAGLALVQLVTASGQTVAATAPAIRAATASNGWSPETGAVTPVATDAPGAWPMTATVYVVMPTDRAAARIDRTLGFFRFFYAEAVRSANALGYVALPPATVAAVETYWSGRFTPRN